MKINGVIQNLQQEVVRNGRTRAEALKRIKTLKKDEFSAPMASELIHNSHIAEHCKQTILNVGKNIKALKSGINTEKNPVDHYC